MGTCRIAQGSSVVLCDDLDGWDWGLGERPKREETHVHI